MLSYQTHFTRAMRHVLSSFYNVPNCICGCFQVIATPFSTNFNHLRIADEIHYKWDRCIHNPVIAAEIKDLPVYGVGHSMGSLQHLLISARYASTSRAGNILMSFNNKPATDAIPFFSPFIAPGARALGPFLAQVCSHPLPLQSKCRLCAITWQHPLTKRTLLTAC